MYQLVGRSERQLEWGSSTRNKSDELGWFGTRSRGSSDSRDQDSHLASYELNQFY